MEEPIPMEVLDDTDADFLAAEATIVNAVSPHVAITDRGGTPKVQRVTVTDVDGTEHFDVSDGAKGDTGDAAGFGTISISMDPNNPGPGTPAVDYSTSGSDTAKNLSLIFKNLKGDTGDAAGFGTINISMDPNNPGPGTPAVDYSTSGPDTAKNLSLIFKNLKGAQGDKGDIGDAAGFGTINISMDPNNPGPGTPAVDYSTSGPDTAKNLSLIFKNLKGIQGDKGDTGDTGPQGPQGIQGPKGDRGDPGTTILEYAGVANFPNPGISGMAYVDTTTNTMYRWTGSGYESISNAVSYASQSEAEAGIDNTKAMTPLRTRQALEAYAMTMQDVDTAVNQGLANNLGGV